jgi:transposase
MQAYSKDLRIRVIDAVDRGMPRTEVADQFMVSLRTIKRWLQRRRLTGNWAESPRPGPPAHKLGPLRAGLPAQLQAHPAATLEEHRALWAEAHGVQVSISAISRVMLRDLGWTRKKSRAAPANATSQSGEPGGSGPRRSSRAASSGSTSLAATPA